MSFHTVVAAGNLGRDPELRYTPSGQAVCNFNVATNRKYTTSAGEPVEEVVWFRISAWGKTAENCNQFLRKGSQVLVEGRLQADGNGGPRVWERQDGTPAASFEINAQTVRFLSGGGRREEEESHAPASDDDIPF